LVTFSLAFRGASFKAFAGGDPLRISR